MIQFILILKHGFLVPKVRFFLQSRTFFNLPRVTVAIPGTHGNSAFSYGYGCLAQRLVTSWRQMWSQAADTQHPTNVDNKKIKTKYSV